MANMSSSTKRDAQNLASHMLRKAQIKNLADVNTILLQYGLVTIKEELQLFNDAYFCCKAMHLHSEHTAFVIYHSGSVIVMNNPNEFHQLRRYCDYHEDNY